MEMPLYSFLIITSWTIFIVAVLVGYVICYFLITPMLLKKYKNRAFFESFFGEGLQAENHLKELLDETNDLIVQRTLKIIRYSKIVIVVSIIAIAVITVLEGVQ
jgi:Na+/glutamate symporter